MAAKIDDERETLFARFDEKEYIEKEMTHTKVPLYTLGYALAIGFASFGLVKLATELVPVAFLLGIFAIINLKMFYEKAGIDTSKFEKGNWFGNGMMTFFSWLAIWIILSNPPISDMANPSVNNVDLYKVDNAYVEDDILVAEDNKTVEFSKYAEDMKAGDTIIFKADIVDNYQLEKSSLRVEVTRPDKSKLQVSLMDTTGPIKELFRTSVVNKTNSTDPQLPFNVEEESYFFGFEIPTEGQVKGEYTFTIRARDSFDNDKIYIFKRTVA